jgi:hypothetical protein
MQLSSILINGIPQPRSLATCPQQIEISTTNANSLLSLSPEIEAMQFNFLDGKQAEHVGAFKRIHRVETKERSKSFSLQDGKITGMQMPTFSPIIVNSYESLSCSNKLCQAVMTMGFEMKPQKRTYCSKCSVLMAKHQYCIFCKQIYEDTSMQGAVVDGLEWIQCEVCMKWVFGLLAPYKLRGEAQN